MIYGTPYGTRTCPGLTSSWASAVPWISVYRHCWPKAGIRMKAKGCPVPTSNRSGLAPTASPRTGPPAPFLVQLAAQRR